MFNMEKRYRNKIIIIILLSVWKKFIVCMHLDFNKAILLKVAMIVLAFY